MSNRSFEGACKCLKKWKGGHLAELFYLLLNAYNPMSTTVDCSIILQIMNNILSFLKPLLIEFIVSSLACTTWG